MILPEYDELDAIGLAEKIKKNEISPLEALNASIERIEERDPHLNSVVLKLYNRARSRIPILPNGPLHGVPFLLKDLKAALVGTPTSNSSKLTKNYMPTHNSLIVDRYEAAGLQIVGKSNTPEFGIMGVTEPAIRPPCRNPWNTEHTPGGSSGGASASVASRLVPVAHAGDGGGSIRIPASHCGLFGIKPTRGRVSMAPHRGEAWAGFVQENVVSRSVRDSAALLDVVDPITPGDPYAAPHKERPWLEEVRREPGKLRIAFDTGTLFGEDNHPECIKAVEHTLKMLQKLGHEVVEARPIFPKEELIRAYFLTVATGTAVFVEETSEIVGVKPKAKNFEPATWLLAQIGWNCDAPTYLRAKSTVQKASRGVASFFEEHDVFLTSTAAVPPQRVGEQNPTIAEKIQMNLVQRANLSVLLDFALNAMGSSRLAQTPNTQLFNQTGQPAMSVPLYWTDLGLPIGVQFAGKFGGEATLFRLASQLEQEQPWAHRKPPLLDR
ncbi:MAG: amidase [Deltaproteobacteria bacterium]|nr:amidase [Deltaproteobacteria bacterium]